MKVLPNEFPPPNSELEKEKKKEYVFKKDDELITPVDSSIETNEIDSVLPTESLSKDSEKSLNTSEPFMEIISSIVDPTITSNDIETNLNPSTTTEGVEIMIVERKDLEKTVTNQSPLINGTDDKSDDFGANEDVTIFSTNDIGTHDESEKLLNLSNGGVLKGSELETFHFEDDDDEDGDKKTFDSDEDYGPDMLHTPKPTEYSSRQRSMPSSTLLHGFISNPGYPSFYIGKSSDCKWKLTLQEGQKIALTILDLHLRSELLRFLKRDNDGWGCS